MISFCQLGVEIRSAYITFSIKAVAVIPKVVTQKKWAVIILVVHKKKEMGRWKMQKS